MQCFSSTSTKILEDILNYSFKISQQTTKQNANLESFKWQVANAQMRLHDERHLDFLNERTKPSDVSLVYF